MVKQWYMFIYMGGGNIFDYSLNNLGAIKVEDDTSLDDLLLKIYEKSLDNRLFLLDVLRNLNSDQTIHLKNIIFTESCKIDLVNDINVIEHLVKYGSSLSLWLDKYENPEIYKKKINIGKKIFNENLSDYEKIEIMKKMGDKFLMGKSETWNKEREKYKEKIKKLEEKLKYTPGNEGYFEVMENFDSRKSTKKN